MTSAILVPLRNLTPVSTNLLTSPPLFALIEPHALYSPSSTSVRSCDSSLPSIIPNVLSVFVTPLTPICTVGWPPSNRDSKLPSSSTVNPGMPDAIPSSAQYRSPPLVPGVPRSAPPVRITVQPNASASCSVRLSTCLSLHVPTRLNSRQGLTFS